MLPLKSNQNTVYCTCAFKFKNSEKKKTNMKIIVLSKCFIASDTPLLDLNIYK